MRLGQTSLVFFLSRFAASMLGFVATIYFARLLGAEVLGTYYLTLAVVSWLAIAGEIGISGAISKRVSEGRDRDQYAIAGVLLVGALATVLTAVIFVFRSQVDTYVGYPAAGYVVLLLVVTLGFSIVSSLLTGFHLVHVTGLLSPAKTGGRSLLQIAMAVAGLGLVGLFVGYALGYVLVAAIGLAVIVRQLDGASLPRRRHFRHLVDYAKFSWLGNLQSKMFNYTDVLVLGLFVPSGLVGIYSVAWNVAQFLILFASAVSTTFFPEMSKVSVDQDPQAVANLVEDSLSFAGLLLIPGLVGGVLLGDRLLEIYGDEFSRGATVLAVLIVANLVMSYQNQLLNTLNAIDRPDLSFRVNAVFIAANVSLNVALIYAFGWIGAAVATAVSVSISLVIAYYYLDSIVDFVIPARELVRQSLAALCMGVVVYGGLFLEETYRVLGHNFALVVSLVGLGAAVYFVIYFTISSPFRTIVLNNLPFGLATLRSSS